MAIWTLSDTASGLPYISLLILTFLNCCISVKTSLINTKLVNLGNLGVLFLTIACFQTMINNTGSVLLIGKDNGRRSSLA